MYEGLLHLHSTLRWILLILLLLAIFKSVADRRGPFELSHRRIGLWLMIVADITLLIGIYQWITGPWGLKNIQNTGMSEVMANDYSRFYAVEHTLGMLIAIALIHVGRAIGKKDLPGPARHRRTILMYTLALLIILISIPWPFREVGAGRSWLPGM
ncbi:MAG TPA: hypothetical protein VEB63_01645 [Chitinophagaceae bacterium]|nr:hypothetical protein [Chitinophagaceae bacterium]